MKYTKFTIKNFKGIKNLTLDLSCQPRSNIYTLVGLNESGKTTLLEAINFFQEKIKPEESHKLIPKSKQSNFNNAISVEAEVLLDGEDEKDIAKFLKSKNFAVSEPVVKIGIEISFSFKNSKYETNESLWSLEVKGKKGKTRALRSLDSKDEIWQNLTTYIEDKCLPSIIYYPNFLKDFPSRISLEGEADKEQDFYRRVIQDVLDSMQHGLKLNEHIVQRVKSDNDQDKSALEATMLQMGGKITDVIFSAWGELFDSSGKEIIVSYGIDQLTGVYLELKLKEGTEQYQITERSLGFKWFFSFLLFTEFRKNRAIDRGEILFLIDEPASNLHSTAQRRLLSSFESLVSSCKLIYATHSHHLINPDWLAGTYIVINKAIDYENINQFDSSKTDIDATLYRSFVGRNPEQKTYFQPILDRLEYQPSLLEQVPNIIVLEGKNDYYTFKYLNEVILENRYSDLNFYPGTGASNNGPIIQLYLAWGRDLAILLDSDQAGTRAKNKYITNFGEYVSDKIFTYKDIDEEMESVSPELLFSEEEQIEIIKTIDPAANGFDKLKFNTAIQNLFIDKTEIELSDETKNKFIKIFEFLNTTQDS